MIMNGNRLLNFLLAFPIFCLLSCGGGGSDSPNNGGGEVSKEYINVTPNVELLADGQTQDIQVSANCQWTVTKSADASWLTISPTSGSNSQTITVTAQRNSSTSSRSAVITISGSTRKSTVTITQSGQAAQLTVDKSSMAFTSTGGSESFSITSNGSWTITAPEWCTLSQQNGTGNATITVKVSANSTVSVLSGNITVSVNGGSSTIAVSQSVANAPTVTELSVTNVTSTTADCSFTVSSELPLSSCGICYSTIQSTPTINDSMVVSPATSPGSVSISLSSLSPNSSYYIRAYATSAVGTSYSNVVTISTSKQKPGEGDNPTPARKH